MRRVGIHGLQVSFQRPQELIIAPVGRLATSAEIFVGLALFGLPLAGPEPSLLGIDAAIRDLPEQDRGAIHGAVRKSVHQLVKIGLGHSRI